MELFRIHKDIPFMRHALVFNIISLVTFFLAVFFIAYKGLHFSVEFTGGTVMEVAYQEAPKLDELRAGLEKKFPDIQVQTFGSSKDVMIRIPNKAGHNQKLSTQSNLVFDEACQISGGTVKTESFVSEKGEQISRQNCSSTQGAKLSSIKRVEFVGPQVGEELASDGGMALLMVIIGIVLYLWFRFEWRFGLSAIIANLHDVIIILGFFAFFQWEFSLAVLAAVLAILGYSVNESVVIFDRIREAFRRYRKLSTHEVIDHAITSTMSRTIITHGSTQMMVLSMLIFGGPTLHYFAVALTIGILFGIYSSVFVAAAIAMWLGVKREDLVKAVAKDQDPNDPNSGAVV